MKFKVGDMIKWQAHWGNQEPRFGYIAKITPEFLYIRWFDRDYNQTFSTRTATTAFEIISNAIQ